MDVMLQRHCAKHIYIVPDGLKELMSDISREVLRSNPANIYTFVADYLDALIITRENARVAARLVQSIIEITTTSCEFLTKTGLPREEADYIVGIIQRTFKKYLRDCPIVYNPEEEKVDEIEEANIVTTIIDEAQIPKNIAEEAATIIQNAYRSFKQRREKEKELLCGIVDWRVAARSAIRLYRQTGVTNEEANRAATLIKAAYKGYYSRRTMKELAKKKSELVEKVQEVAADEEAKSIGTKSERSVRINYESVIPHVDFDEFNADASQELGESSTNAVVADALDTLLEKSMKIVEEKNQRGIKKGPSQELNEFLPEVHSEEIVESFDVTDETLNAAANYTFIEDELEFDIDIDDDDNDY